MSRSREFIDALDLLTEQHAEVDRLFKLIEGKRGNRRAAVVELADTLAAHTTIEEKLFYPYIMSMSEDTRKLVHESVENHLGIQRMLADMLTKDLDADELDARFSVLREHVSYHAQEEEARLFPAVRKAMKANALALLGNELIVMFEHLMASEPCKLVPDPSAEAVRLPA